jgi:hypothetical protein
MVRTRISVRVSRVMVEEGVRVTFFRMNSSSEMRSSLVSSVDERCLLHTCHEGSLVSMWTDWVSGRVTSAYASLL